MKKILLFSALLVALFFNSCSKDDAPIPTPVPVPVPTILGKWRTEKFDYYLNNQFDGTETYTENNATCPDYTEYKSSGIYEKIELSTNCVSSLGESGTYVLNGTSITYNYNGTTDTGVVKLLTETDLQIESIQMSSQGEIKSVEFFKKVN